MGIASMAEGGVRQLIVPPSIGYPKADMAHETVGPKPTTFSGQRALNFVLENQELIDKTLLFNVKLVRVDEADGKGGFKSSVQDKFKRRERNLQALLVCARVGQGGLVKRQAELAFML